MSSLKLTKTIKLQNNDIAKKPLMIFCYIFKNFFQKSAKIKIEQKESVMSKIVVKGKTRFLSVVPCKTQLHCFASFNWQVKKLVMREKSRKLF